MSTITAATVIKALREAASVTAQGCREQLLEEPGERTYRYVAEEMSHATTWESLANAIEAGNRGLGRKLANDMERTCTDELFNEDVFAWVRVWAFS